MTLDFFATHDSVIWAFHELQTRIRKQEHGFYFLFLFLHRGAFCLAETLSYQVNGHQELAQMPQEQRLG